MFIIDTALTLLFLHSRYVEPYYAEIDQTIGDFEKSLDACFNPVELRWVLESGCVDILPVTIVVDTFEKYLTMNRTDPDMLRIYASYIKDMIPDWNDYSESLKKEADDLDFGF